VVKRGSGEVDEAATLRESALRRASLQGQVAGAAAQRQRPPCPSAPAALPAELLSAAAASCHCAPLLLQSCESWSELWEAAEAAGDAPCQSLQLQLQLQALCEPQAPC
jgi:hypothetical protein